MDYKKDSKSAQFSLVEEGPCSKDFYDTREEMAQIITLKLKRLLP